MSLPSHVYITTCTHQILHEAPSAAYEPLRVRAFDAIHQHPVEPAASLFGGVCMAGRSLALRHWPRVRRRTRCQRLSAVAVIPRINASQRRRAVQAGARRRTGLKRHLVVELRLVVGQRQEGAVVVAAHVLGFRAMAKGWWRWRRRTRRRGGVRAKRACRDGRDDRARSRDVSVAACPRFRRGQLNSFKVDRAGVSLSAVDAARRLHCTFQPTERDVANGDCVGFVSLRAAPPPEPYEAGGPVRASCDFTRKVPFELAMEMTG